MTGDADDVLDASLDQPDDGESIAEETAPDGARSGAKGSDGPAPRRPIRYDPDLMAYGGGGGGEEEE